jgi:hypothetical protein
MATYRFLQDHHIGGYHAAGDTASTADVGGTLPTNWKPTGGVDPLDAAAVNAFYAAGPQATQPVQARWTDVPVSAPVTYWRATSLPAVPGARGLTSWQLTGLGANLPPIVM